MILVTGFGPFPGVHDNPSRTLAQRLHGRVAGGHRIEALVLPVSWQWTLPLLTEAVEVRRPSLIIGFGVAGGRDRAWVEDTAVNRCAGPDADGARPDGAMEGPEVVQTTVDAAALAEALGFDLSHDAGTYLCNAWLYHLTLHAKAPSAFVHIPPAGVDAEAVLEGLSAFMTSREPPPLT